MRSDSYRTRKVPVLAPNGSDTAHHRSGQNRIRSPLGFRPPSKVGTATVRGCYGGRDKDGTRTGAGTRRSPSRRETSPSPPPSPYPSLPPSLSPSRHVVAVAVAVAVAAVPHPIAMASRQTACRGNGPASSRRRGRPRTDRVAAPWSRWQVRGSPTTAVCGFE